MAKIPATRPLSSAGVLLTLPFVVTTVELGSLILFSAGLLGMGGYTASQALRARWWRRTAALRRLGGAVQA